MNRPKRYFKEQIFLGAGDTSAEQILKLHGLLSQALMHVSGQQQNGGMGCGYNDDDAIDSWNAVKAAVEDIGTALTGHQIKIVDNSGQEIKGW